MIDDIFVQSLPEDPLTAGRTICAVVQQYDAERRAGRRSTDDEPYLKVLALFQSFCEANGIAFNFPTIGSHDVVNIKTIVEFFAHASDAIEKEISQSTLRRYKSQYDRLLGKAFHYEFSDGDIQRIQALLNELRVMIAKTPDIADEHRQRLLRRLESLQAELHKKVSDVDRFWGLVGDASILLAKLGTNAKPIVDRVREIAEIVWSVQTRRAELPSNTPIKLLDK